MKLPFAIENAIVRLMRLMRASQNEGEAILHPEKLPSLQQATNRRREELEAVILDELQRGK